MTNKNHAFRSGVQRHGASLRRDEGRGTGDEGIYLLSLPENGRGYVRPRSHIRARFPVARKEPQRVPRPLPRASRDRRYNTLHFARQSSVPKGRPPLESPGVSVPVT